MKKLFIYFSFIVFTIEVSAQSTPTAYDLSSGNYSFTTWLATEPAATYPTNMIFHLGNVQDASLATFTAASDYTAQYNLGGGTRIKGLGTDGFSFVNTATNGYLGEAVLALNASNRQDITIDFTAGLVAQGNGNPTPREYRLRMQYKIGVVGTWTDISPLAEYSSSNQNNGHFSIFSGIVLPSNCNAEPLVLIRWIFYQQAANNGGTRSEIRLDDISVSSSAISCSAPSIQTSALQASNLTGNSVDLSWANGDGTNHIVLGRMGATVIDNPVDGNNYTANTNFGTLGTELGSSYVLYNGTGNNVTINGLQSGQDYYFSVMEFNCNPGIYLTASPATAHITTPTTPTLYSSVSSLPSFSTQVGVPSMPDSFLVSGQYLITDINITSPSQFDISLNYASGYTSSVNLTPISGTVAPTWIYARYNPGSSGLHTGNITMSSAGALPINIGASGNAIVAGSLPPLFNLCSGHYQFTNWAASSAGGTYPNNMRFHRFNAQDPTISAQDTANYILAYNLTSGTRINGLDANGISFLNISTAGNLGAAVIGLNATGRKDITINYLAGLISQTDNNRVYNLRLQYRIANGSWTDIPSLADYTSLGKTPGHDTTYTGIVLPTACDNQPTLYLRWMYYRVGSGSGTRPSIRLDEVHISSTAINIPLSDVQSVPSSEAVSIPSSVTGAINTVADGMQVWSFTITDGGAMSDADLFDTHVQSLTLKQGTANTVSDFTTIIGAIALFQGNTKIADGVVNTNTVLFTSLNLIIPDDGSATYDIRLSLATSGNLIDNSNIQFKLENSDITTSGDCNSSGFTSFSIVSDGTMNFINVLASKLVFTYVPISVTENQSFALIIAARDNYGNTDKSARNIILSLGTPGSGILSSNSGLGPKPMLNGIISWNDLQYNAVETFQVIALDNTGLQNDTLIQCLPDCVAPTTSPSITATQEWGCLGLIKWSAGNGSARMVVMRKNTSVSDLPINGTSYNYSTNYGTSGTELGSGYVVYVGNEDSILVGNLTNSFVYHIAVFELDCSPNLYLMTPSISTVTISSDCNAIEDWNENDLWIFYPNPATDGYIYFTSSSRVSVYDSFGRLIIKSDYTDHIYTTGWASGIYILENDNGRRFKLIIP